MWAGAVKMKYLFGISFHCPLPYYHSEDSHMNYLFMELLHLMSQKCIIVQIKHYHYHNLAGVLDPYRYSNENTQASQ